MEREALKAVIKKYVLYDHFFRRAYLVLVAQMSAILLVFTALFIVKKLPAAYLLLISTGVWLGVGLAASLMVAGAIQREKAEGSFRTLRALPLRAETLFLGTILSGVIASILALVPPYLITTIGLIVLRGWDLMLLQIRAGWAVLLISFLFASAGLTVALCVNSPAVILNVIVGFSTLVTLLALSRTLLDLRPFSEEELLRFARFLLSLEGQALISAIVIVLSGAILYLGSRIFSRQKSYV